MSKLIFFIGPGGSGKSTICSHIEKNYPNLKRVKLDDYEKDSNHRLGISKIEELEKSQDTNIFLIDVGAFFQKHIPENFWSSRKDNMITIYNDPKFCYEVYKNRETSKPRVVYKEHCEKEFNIKRKKLYELPNFKIITNEEVDESVKKAYDFIKKILKN
ncbi:MAG: hypothetical protein UV05_C0036G0007 [candidate division CPR1 bacterium GW2011_GWA2_42_17]|uniref:Uncharacterized protein n=1 Tax=candidate division CPR1 bacterium GW2011_GWA2_42_17 TaxID=1618341 RepID=A0A0G1BZE1_9BACT|nr:MAG: hypothetical protein UV05_C0036G0007 [candidate division CPR1 bacterium GW2011_GWA2_42_17]